MFPESHKTESREPGAPLLHLVSDVISNADPPRHSWMARLFTVGSFQGSELCLLSFSPSWWRWLQRLHQSPGPDFKCKLSRRGGINSLSSKHTQCESARCRTSGAGLFLQSMDINLSLLPNHQREKDPAALHSSLWSDFSTSELEGKENEEMLFLFGQGMCLRAPFPSW